LQEAGFNGQLTTDTGEDHSFELATAEALSLMAVGWVK
jgi:hypothetical protein